jgi:phospholipid/cholesterol/gamma-HCH transport system substrate-binding protein
MAEEAKKTAENIRMASEKAHKIIADFQEKSSKGFTEEAQGTIRNLNEVLTDMADNTEALKRNFFFRGFFQRRGYYDLDNISVADYQAGILSKTRYEKKFWLAAKDLFEPGPQETLSERGKKLVTDTIKELFRYQNDPVFIVEGYASEGTAADQYLRSRQRAVQVKNHLLLQFPIPPESIGVMPLGLKINQLTSETWDGVALVVYYLPNEE